MKLRASSLLVIAGLTAVLFSLGVAPGQGKYRDRARNGPFRVVLSKPVAALGHDAGELYREHEYLSAMFNQLDREGLVPVHTELLRVADGGRLPVERLMVVCRER